jgi:hypothetical protein
MALGILLLALATLMTGSASGEEVVLEPRGIEGSDLVVDVLARDLRRIGSFDVTVSFDPARLDAPRREDGSITAGTMAADNVPQPGRYRLAVIAPVGISGDGALATLRFPRRGGLGAIDLDLDVRLTDLNGSAIPVRVRGARVQVDGLEPTRREDAAAPTEDVSSGDAEADDAPPGESLEASKGPREAADSEPNPPASEPLDAAARERAAERERAHRAAQLEGFTMHVRFDPEERFAESAPTAIRAELRAFRHGTALPLAADDVSLTAIGATVRTVRPAEDFPGLEIEVDVDPDALPARLEVGLLGLYEDKLVPVYPRVDVDYDGSGDLSARDGVIMTGRVGTQQGDARYEERFDIVRDGRIDAEDLAAFRFNLIETERARRLKALESQAEDGASKASDG